MKIKWMIYLLWLLGGSTFIYSQKHEYNAHFNSYTIYHQRLRKADLDSIRRTMQEKIHYFETDSSLQKLREEGGLVKLRIEINQGVKRNKNTYLIRYFKRYFDNIIIREEEWDESPLPNKRERRVIIGLLIFTSSI